MNDIFIKNAYLLSFPSETAHKNSEFQKNDVVIDDVKPLLNQYLNLLAHELSPPWALQQTMFMLNMTTQRMLQNPSKTEFSLSASSLADLVTTCDRIGPAKFGWYYNIYLVEECKWLLPKAIKEYDYIKLDQLIKTWQQNRHKFRCSVIGPALCLSCKLLEKAGDVHVQTIENI